MNVFGSTVDSERNRIIANLKSSLEKTNNDLNELRQIVNKHEVKVDMLEEKIKIDLSKMTTKIEKIDKRTEYLDSDESQDDNTQNHR